MSSQRSADDSSKVTRKEAARRLPAAAVWVPAAAVAILAVAWLGRLAWSDSPIETRGPSADWLGTIAVEPPSVIEDWRNPPADATETEVQLARRRAAVTSEADALRGEVEAAIGDALLDIAAAADGGLTVFATTSLPPELREQLVLDFVSFSGWHVVRYNSEELHGWQDRLDADLTEQFGERFSTWIHVQRGVIEISLPGGALFPKPEWLPPDAYVITALGPGIDGDMHLDL